MTPIYILKCPDCKTDEEIKMSIATFENKVVLCPKCREVMSICFQPALIVMSDKPRKKQLTGWRKSIF